MTNTTKKKIKINKNKTSKKKMTHAVKFEQDISYFFLKLLLVIKLYHWNTHSYAAHKSTDELYESLNKHMDRFMEILFGKTGKRLSFKNISLEIPSISTKKEIEKYMTECKGYLVDLNDNIFLHKMSNFDLFTIRDEILGDLNQFLYLLSFM